MTSHQNCDLCVSGSNSSKIIGYCKDCNGYLCDICYQTHTKAKAFRQHSIDQGATAKQSADKEVASLGKLDLHEQICRRHKNEKTSLFCRKHLAVICGRCLLQKHMVCEDQVVDLIEVSNQSTDHLNEILHGLEHILNDTKCIEKDVILNNETNNSAREDSFKAVRDFRKKIDEYFDKLQRQIEQEIRQCHLRNERILTAQLKTCFEVKESALIKQKEINVLSQKNQKSTLYVTIKNFKPDIETLKQTLNEASRKLLGPMYEFQKSDVINNLVSTENVLGTVEDIHTGSDMLTHNIHVHEPNEEPLKVLENTKWGNNIPTTIQTKIADLLHDLIVVRRADNATVLTWIVFNVDNATTTNTQFIRELMTAVCQSAIKGEKGKEKLELMNISVRKDLLQKFLNRKPLFELQALFALQALVTRLGHPQGLLLKFFDILYDEYIITEDAFIEWEKSEDEPEGKETALKQVVKFFEWMKEAEETDEDFPFD